MTAMSVERIQTERRSHIVPEFDQRWSALQKLQWHAAVVEVDCGIRLEVHAGSRRTLIFGKWREVPGSFSISGPRFSVAPFTFDGAWDYLNGFSAGVRAVTP